jgi:hypothetical protein
VLSEVSEMGEDKEYFVWEPYKNAEHKKKITIKGFDMDPISEYANITNSRGVAVKGLVKIAMEDEGSTEINNSEEYNIKFSGRMKIIRDISEEEIIKKDKQRKASRDGMRKRREGVLKPSTESNISEYFPRKELDSKLNDILYYIEEDKLKNLVYYILGQSKVLNLKQALEVYKNPLWTDAIREFMQGKEDFKKEGDRYVRIQK